MNLHCYYFAPGSFILNFKEALLEVADIKRRRDEFIHNVLYFYNVDTLNVIKHEGVWLKHF